MADVLEFQRRVDARMQGFMAGRKKTTRADFAAELAENLAYEASHMSPAPTDDERHHVRDLVEAKYASKLVNF